MYHIDVIDVEEQTGSWGEFMVKKDFIVKLQANSSAAANVEDLTNKMKKMSIVKDNTISGFILQYVTKKTSLYALCKENVLQKIKNIDEFTTNRVKYMNDSYYELFPIINGKTIYPDSFQNGAVLRYEKDKTKWYANNNPPTKGEIAQEGTCYFISEEKSIVKRVISVLEKSIRKRSAIPITLFGIEWDMNPMLPANGLPYTEDIEDIGKLKKSNTVYHVVHVEWNGIESKKNENTKNSKNNKSCEPINETNNESNKRSAITHLKSIFTEI